MFGRQIVVVFPAYGFAPEASCARKRHSPFTTDEAQFAFHKIGGKISVL